MDREQFQMLSEIIVFFWDEESNFYNESTQAKIGIPLFKEVHLVKSRDDFSNKLTSIKNPHQKILFFVHLFHNAGSKGRDTFRSSKISYDYPKLNVYFISSAPRQKVYSKGTNESVDVFSYDNFHERIGKMFRAQTKEEIIDTEGYASTTTEEVSSITTVTQNGKYPKVEFGIITALYKDEFDAVKEYFVWDEKDNIQTETKVYRIGSLKGEPDRKVVAAVPAATGMVDAAIIATQMLELFKPDFLIMSGVCGGDKKLKFGDIVLARNIFTFQKGKISDLKTADGKPIILYDSAQQKVDWEHLYDEKGNQIDVTVEKFEIEQDTMIEIDPVVKDRFESSQDEIEYKINKYLASYNKKVDIYFEAMACSTMVINKEGFFESKIKLVDRKTVAVEMESYGVARACQFANDGKTKHVIFKSVMDNMSKKTDAAKKFAGRTSALFLKHLIYDGILKRSEPANP